MKIIINGKPWKSKIFKEDENEYPIDVFKLTPEKTLSTKSPWKLPSNHGYELAIRLKKIIKRNFTDQPSLENYVIKESQEQLEQFKHDLMSMLSKYDLIEEKLKPELDGLLHKSKKKITADIKKNGQYHKYKKRENYDDLIHPLFYSFKKCLPKINDRDCFHYVAHLLIETDVEPLSKEKGHRKVFEKVRKYHQRVQRLRTTIT